MKLFSNLGCLAFVLLGVYLLAFAVYGIYLGVSWFF